MGKSWILQNVRYEFSADVYVRWEELSMDNPSAIDCLCMRWSNDHGSLLGWQEPCEMLIIFWLSPALLKGVER